MDDAIQRHALAGQHGTIRWSVTLGGPLESSPTIADGLIYAGSAVSDSSGSLVAVGLDGKIVRSYQTGGQVNSNPVAADGWVYVGSDNGEVLAVRVPAS